MTGTGRMRLDFVHQPLGPIWLPPTGGSLGIWVHEVARRLAADHDVTVHVRRGRRQSRTEVHEGVRYARVGVFPDPWRAARLERRAAAAPGSLPAFARRAFYSSFVARAARSIARGGAEVVHLFNFAQFAPEIRARAPGAAIALHMHCDWLAQLDPAWAVEQLRAVDAVVACSRHVAAGVERRVPGWEGRCETIQNGVDLRRFRPADDGDARPRQDGARRVLFVGRTSPEKGLHVLIDAFALVARAEPRATLEIVGPEWVAPPGYIFGLGGEPVPAGLRPFFEGSYVGQLRARAARLGLGDAVVFRGAVSHADLPDVYRGADVLVNPSLSESFGMSLIEAMACGLPVVATRVGGMVEVVEDGRTGRLVDPDDAPALAEALLAALLDPSGAAAQGRAGRRRAEERYGWEGVAAAVEDLGRRLRAAR